jgi:hypothetical protein
LQQPDKPTRNALIDTGRHRAALRELELLERTERLFARFPESRHHVVVEHLHLRSSKIPTEADEGFERALREDAELHTFLTHCRFLLPARLEGVRRGLASDAGRVEEFRVPCPACAEGSLCLEQDFYESLI